MGEILKFDYKELGNKDKVRAYTIELEDDKYVLKIRKDNKVFNLKKEDIENIFNKYDFKKLSFDTMYPFKPNEQIDYRIKIHYKNGDVLDFNGYSHYPEFYNDFISDLAKLCPGRAVSVLKVKDEMIDKDNKYITNYIEKVSVFTTSGELIISKDRLNEEEYDVDVSVNGLNKYFKKNDLNFVLPINVHYFTYLFNKKCNFSELGDTRKKDYEFYIDVRLHNKKHRYFDLNDSRVLESLKILLDYLKIFSKLPIFEAYIDTNFVNSFLNSHNIPKTKAEVNDEFIKYLSEGKALLDSLKLVAKGNSNYSMYELISLAYQNQDYYYSYVIDRSLYLKEYIIDSEEEKRLNKYFKKKDFLDYQIHELSDDYDAIYYVENDEIHIAILSSKYEDLKFLKLKDELRSPLIEFAKNIVLNK